MRRHPIPQSVLRTYKINSGGGHLTREEHNGAIARSDRAFTNQI